MDLLRVPHASVNWCLLADADSVTIVDAGLPRHWSLLPKALARLGRRLDDVRALVLTHGHYDHVGFAERARRELGVPVYAPRGEDIYHHDAHRAAARRQGRPRRQRADLATLDRIGETGASHLLPGHGDP
jgi:glyoxylase-like metal-dependent hydrolase (beta-lactamase superfamily II)